MKKKAPTVSVLWILARMIIFCSLWLLFFSHPFIPNLLYAIALFTGSEIMLYCSRTLINNFKNKHN